MFNTRLFKQGRNLCNTLVKNYFVNMFTNKESSTVLNEDEIPAEKVKTFPCLYDKSSRWYRGWSVARNAWVEVAKKLACLEDCQCC